MNLNLQVTKPVFPKWKKGDRKDALVVIANLGFSHIHPDTDRRMSKRMHWYRVQCDCGEVETINQPNLIARKACIQCGPHKQRIDQAAKAADEMPPADVPDFTRLKLR